LDKHPLKEKSLIGGDFNFVENPLIDRTSSSQGGNAGLKKRMRVSQELDLIDLFRNYSLLTKRVSLFALLH
jgi:hypothetical protein